MKYLLFLLIFLITPSYSGDEVWVSVDLHQPYKHRFIVQNLASLTLRVYQRNCDFQESCSNTLIFQAPMVVGKDEDSFRTNLGAFTISSWTKFHQDYEGDFKPWNSNPQPPGVHRSQWGKVGAFGWFTAFLEPRAEGQWLHGTVGWGEDGENYIEHTRTIAGGFDRLRSKGCTRVSNQSIAFLRNFVPAGSYLFRIYALEDFADPSLTKYRQTPFYNSWVYGLSKRKNENDLYPLENFSSPLYEKNILIYSQFPTKVIVKPKGEEIKKQKNYNPYGLFRKEFRGLFLVDQGVVSNYLHPQKLLNNNVRLPQFFKNDPSSEQLAKQ